MVGMHYLFKYSSHNKLIYLLKKFAITSDQVYFDFGRLARMLDFISTWI